MGDHRQLLAALFLALLAACNTVPTAPTVQIRPADPTTTNDLTVEITADATDNGRVLFYRTTWTRDGDHVLPWTTRRPFQRRRPSAIRSGRSR